MNEERPGRAFWIGLVIGGAIMTFGVVGLLAQVPLSTAGSIGLWVVGGDLIHDLVVAPVVCAVGLLLARWIRPFWRWPVRAGFITSACVLVVAYPALRGFGRAHVPDNETVQPLNYATAVLTVLGVVWGIVAVWGLANTWRARSHDVGEHAL